MNRRVVSAVVAIAFGFAVCNLGHAATDDEPLKVTVIEDNADKSQGSPKAQPAPVTCNLAAPIDAAQGEAIVRKVAVEERFDSDLVLAIARQESGFRMSSISSAGAVGLMQLMPGTAKRFEVDICDPEDNVRGGIRYLRLLQKRYQNLLYVLAAYNAGEGAVDQSRGVPLYPETVRYVSAILTDLNGWKPLQVPVVKSRPAAQPNTQEKPQGETPEAWSQGFVLHVE
ncbi:lytic transglycosylase domain-containing protein [Phyllobacterium endophyticum]|uniref:lytic transglycosylase domain-containing protein n=1 Tax=Phyllobacterium endophyticum TaxID=1149773 RepID=UPI0011CAF09A|nr:lytic transglycosylase domain-containing protein [Phyllobacterium endophyticum]TXR46848.1 lytic transglycosylase domain-containing protein [Phyllobacterium endophyticum]